MFRFQWGNSQYCGYTVSASSLMLLSAAKMGLGNDGQHLETSQVTSCQWERGSVEAMLTLPHTALTSTCCPEVLSLKSYFNKSDDKSDDLIREVFYILLARILIVVSSICRFYYVVEKLRSCCFIAIEEFIKSL